MPFPLTDFELAESAPFGALPDEGWIPAPVPGGVHAALVAAGRFADPYRDRNEEAARWVEARSWWYRCRVDLPDAGAGERLRLVLHGLDTVATVWLDGDELGRHANMFRPAEYDVTRHAGRPAELLVRFDPPLAGLDPDDSPPSALLSGDRFEPTSVQRRKPTYSWGWDFAPRLPSIGLWRPVELVHDRGAALNEVHFRTRALDTTARTADLSVDVQVDRLTDAPLTARILWDGECVAEQPVLDAQACATFSVTDVRPWWTHDLGTPDRYRLTVEIRDADTVVARRSELVGVRTVELDRSPDPDGGRLFRFVLNGVPLYARGACVVPASMQPGCVPDETQHELVRLAATGNMTMLRVWGGGVYGDDAFYDAADELGVLVWQDFMFSCLDYPDNADELNAEVAAEAVHQVRRLRNRPSLALWAGNNEVQAIHQLRNGDLASGEWGSRFFHETLPAAVSAHHPDVPYWPGSPWGQDDPAGVNGVLDGDRHAWEVWHGLDVGAPSPVEYTDRGEAMHFDRYRFDTGKFISEFGIIAAPERTTLAQWISPDELTLHSPTFDAHVKDNPVRKAELLLAAETGLPTDLDSYIDATMAVQAEGLKFGIEHYRRRQPGNSGALIWQLNDPWPGVSWSLIDHALRPKAAYHAVRRAFRPVLASFVRDESGGLDLWITSSGVRPVRSVLAVEVLRLDGSVILAEHVTVDVPAGTSRKVWSAPADRIGSGPDRVAWVSSTDGAVPGNRLLFGRIKDIDWPASTLETTYEATGQSSGVLKLTSRGYSFQARVTCDDPGARFSENYLDLRDGDTAHITVTGLSAPTDTATFTARAYRGPRPGAQS
ncbi:MULTISPECIES: glycoside hydrolase family 2 protein [unclassified Streptomyces]|uniref:beta-mannosidase n=1 Tax=unclassified Streptomyces TaxID=2593676 RepID=UPI000DBAB297|nr:MULTISPECIES: glycoside hydrolase family 2 protein [unclassified Streptomyces]MYT73489.1 glycoside hydrolase family 2 protein [Streptomyces sp. SID8367]RAJ85022.1 beta-mannosidase [Streptomyces sp. PsTaAH-137]